MRTFRFYKEIGTRWYVDLPEWDGDKEELEMVSGADLFMEILAQGEPEINVVLSVTDFPGSSQLVFTELGRLEHWEMGHGAWYRLEGYFGLELSMWLCDVTTFVFGHFPEKIYFCKLD